MNILSSIQITENEATSCIDVYILMLMTYEWYNAVFPEVM